MPDHWTTSPTAADDPALSVDQRRRVVRSQVALEAGLAERWTVATAAQPAAFSPFHFHRLFRRVTGEPLAGHLRRLRLERAAFDLVHTRWPVLEVALTTGFESAAAFTRAFQRHHGLSPRRFRQARPARIEPLRLSAGWADAFARLPVEWRVEPPQTLRFLRRQGTLPMAVTQAHAAMQEVLARSNFSSETPLLACTPDYPGITAPDRLRFDVGLVAGERPLASDELLTRTLPGGRYAVFHIDAGSNPRAVLHPLWQYLYRVWAPARGVGLRAVGAYETFRRPGGGGWVVELHVPVA